MEYIQQRVTAVGFRWNRRVAVILGNVGGHVGEDGRSAGYGIAEEKRGRCRGRPPNGVHIPRCSSVCVLLPDSCNI